MGDLIDGKVATIAEITERGQLRPSNVSRVLQLACFGPDIAAAILERQQPTDLPAKSFVIFAIFPSIGQSSAAFSAFLPSESPQFASKISRDTRSQRLLPK